VINTDRGRALRLVLSERVSSSGNTLG
jgi:hypothetical protein